MKVIHVREYNKFKQPWDEWLADGGYSSLQPQPKQAFYRFCTNRGMFRKMGYVAFDDHRAIWGKTKKEAIATFMKRGDTHGR